MRITVKDKSSAAEHSFDVNSGVPVSSLVPQLAAGLGAIVGPEEFVKPILERTGEALQVGQSLEANGVTDGDVLLLARGSTGGGIREDRIAEFEASLALIGAASRGMVVGTRVAPGRYALEVHDIEGFQFRDGKVCVVSDHRVEITMPAGFPKEKPVVNMGAGMFHPNCWGSGSLCYEFRPAWSGTEFVHAILEFLSARSFRIEERPANRAATDWYSAHPEEVRRVAAAPWPFKVPVVGSALALAVAVA